MNNYNTYVYVYDTQTQSRTYSDLEAIDHAQSCELRDRDLEILNSRIHCFKSYINLKRSQIRAE